MGCRRHHHLRRARPIFLSRPRDSDLSRCGQTGLSHGCASECGDGWAGEREYVCEERAAKIVDGEREEKGSYLVESGQTEIRPLLIFASPRRFVSSLIQCLNRVKGIEARGRAGGEQGNSAPTQTTV
ncbi:hypothetical protein TIFTF001_053381 [Ficus carica]|uniref:Uncharacterized protein n=1 Tax=Ficus carica TaxID=3494 RepID=A0AA88EAS0_FICCA|nr:hypothetical protein TIFTF001_053381 [Ficus carica]